jgi:hypothetical protein
MRLYCHGCFKSVSNEVPSTTILRAVVFCPECIERVDGGTFDHVIEQMRDPTRGRQEEVAHHE